MVTQTKREFKKIIKDLEKQKKDLEKEISIFNKIDRLEKGLNRTGILKRDNYKCKICGGNSILNVHHLHPKDLGGSSKQDNLLTLCKSCHLFMHCNPKLIMLEKENHSVRTKEGLKYAKNVGKRGKDKKPRKREYWAH